MDAILLEKLNQYCEHVVDGKGTTQPTGSKPKKTKHKKKKCDITETEIDFKQEESDEETEVISKKERKKKKKCLAMVDDTSEENQSQDKLHKKKKKESKVKKDHNNEAYLNCSEIIDEERGFKVVAGEKITEDGFKVVSFIPDDDSDVSDAFESDIDMDNWSSSNAASKNTSLKTVASQNETKVTEDGFKIITEIPADDSDVSDAFTDTDDEGFITAEELLTKKKQLNLEKPLKKPFLKIMDDFGINNTSLLKTSKEEKLKGKGSQKMLTLAAQKRPQEEVVVFDYSKKRGKGKKEVKVEEKEEDTILDILINEKNKSIGKLRYDVLKFGMGGLEKKKRELQRTQIAVNLGAKPKKNMKTNYKCLIDMKKRGKVDERKERIEKGKDGIRVKKKGQKKGQVKVRQNINKVSNLSGQIGREKDGVLVLSKSDIRRIEKS